MKLRQSSPDLIRNNNVVVSGETRKIADFLRRIALEIEQAGHGDVCIPSQIGPFLEIDGNRVCLCILDQSRMAAAQVSNGLLSTLSRRQHEILMELVKGHSAKTIAEHLGIHPRTVEAHIYRIYQKTGTHGIVQLMEVFFAQL
ncbi:helix-turn-helix transcriptional regulator [Shinella sp. HZN7]|jgi:DNA-binding CsgD family transcriptional regulator|uniref:helix-turn-helix domain-containing protein n=1 Tax=Shinella sp. (strain HZN7) TaxID=879274 RepID=UPI000A03A9EA|nr:LuxR family transcriptional regulator [Shinella sp. HZN7]